MKKTFSLLLTAGLALQASSQSVEPIKYGNFNSWITREIKESAIIGGKTRPVYEIGPTKTIIGAKPYFNGDSPWGTSNVYAHVSGITKTSNAVFPSVRSGSNKCAKLTAMMERVKVLGLINMDVMVAGSIFLGEIIEPITSTKNPYSKMEMGMPYTKSPKYLVFDYMADIPTEDIRVKATGFGSPKKIRGRDEGVVFVFLQRRWEDSEGNIHALRVATGGEAFTKSSPWVNGHKLKLAYGDISAKLPYPWLALRNGENAYYARNSKGEMRKVMEEGWDKADATPTHAVLMFSSGNGEAYVGTPGLTIYVDNVGFGF